jgi:hypothetical protein
MTMETEVIGIDETIEQVEETARRIAGLLDIMVVRDSEPDCTSEMIDPEKELERTAPVMQALAAGLEVALEILDHDRYLQWLFSIPADSPLFETRKAHAREQITNRL